VCGYVTKVLFKNDKIDISLPINDTQYYNTIDKFVEKTTGFLWPIIFISITIFGANEILHSFFLNFQHAIKTLNTHSTYFDHPVHNVEHVQRIGRRLVQQRPYGGPPTFLGIVPLERHERVQVGRSVARRQVAEITDARAATNIHRKNRCYSRTRVPFRRRFVRHQYGGKRNVIVRNNHESAGCFFFFLTPWKNAFDEPDFVLDKRVSGNLIGKRRKPRQGTARWYVVPFLRQTF